MKKNERGRQLRRPFLSDKVTVLPRNRRLSNAAVKCFFVQNDTSDQPGIGAGLSLSCAVQACSQRT